MSPFWKNPLPCRPIHRAQNTLKRPPKIPRKTTNPRRQERQTETRTQPLQTLCPRAVRSAFAKSETSSYNTPENPAHCGRGSLRVGAIAKQFQHETPTLHRPAAFRVRAPCPCSRQTPSPPAPPGKTPARHLPPHAKRPQKLSPGSTPTSIPSTPMKFSKTQPSKRNEDFTSRDAAASRNWHPK